MSSVYQRGDRWYLRFRDHTGKWRDQRCAARSKTEARRLADDLQRKCERQRLGLEAVPDADGGGTFSALITWWLLTYSKASPSHSRNESTLKHLLDSELAPLRLVDVTSGKIESFLQGKSEDLGPQSINHLRRFILTAFNRAKRAGRFTGPNPAADVQRRKVPRRPYDYLRASEVPLVLGALAPKWRPLFAAALFTGLRRGELLGLRKQDVDLDARLLTVCRSHARDTTKGGHADVIPIASDLLPYLRSAIDASPSDLVFPKEDGTMMRPDVDLEGLLRRTLRRAGIVTGWKHKCRKKGCTHVEDAEDAALRRCPVHNHKLWPTAKVRPLRFHDLRHTTASLLMMAGASPAAVQRIMRHNDPRITMDFYGHLAPDFLRAEVDRLHFAVSPPLAAPVLQTRAERAPTGTPRRATTPQIPRDPLARPRGLEPLTYGSGGRRAGPF
jgi:integrase